MGSKQQLGILKRDGLGKQHFDMENILTRSLYRVINNTTHVPQNVAAKNQNVDKMIPNRKTTVAVALPNNHQIGNSNSVDMNMQMRLLAQEICGRVERKYERKLEDARERDRRDTERRLITIRSEYEAKHQLQLGKLKKDRIRLLDQISERERTLEHRMEMRSAEREHDLAAKQRTVENRILELQLNKENFEKTREEWNRKVEGEMEELRLERERVELSAAKNIDKRKSDIAVEAEVSMWKKRTADLEHDANETRKKIGEMMEENFRLKDQVGAFGHVQQELHVTLASLNETRDDLAASRVEIRRTGDYDQVKQENEDLRMEIERLRLQNATRIKTAIEETIAEYSAKESKWKRVAGLSQQRIAVLTDRLKDSEMERDVLRQELKTMQKMVGRGRGTSSQKQYSIQKKGHSMIRSVSPSESTSSLSDGEMELLNIRQRIQNLDDIAKELDASVEHFSMTGTVSKKAFERNESNVELYDDFCRALHQAVIDDEGSPIQKTSSPQKPLQKSRRQSALIEQEAVGETPESDRDSWLKRGMRVVSPPTAKRNLEVRPVTPEENVQIEKKEEPVEKQEVPAEPQLSEFERRMQARGAAGKDHEDRRNRILQMSTAPEQPEESKEPETSQQVDESEQKPTSVDNPMFTGVNPAMAEYMKRVLEARSQNPVATTSATTPEAPRVREVEVTLADELELELDQPAAANDDWW